MGSDQGSAESDNAFSKVPEVTLAFWIVKICATTLGETGGDALSMSMNLGYAVSTLIFLAFFLITVTAQIKSERYHPLAYWAVVVATTTVGTTTSDLFDRTLGLGYVLASIILFGLVVAILVTWHLSTGRIEFSHIANRKAETFYWVTILVSNTLGTALGDFTADDVGLGFQKGALVFAALIVIVAAIHYFSDFSEAVLFWAAYVLTRPLGATLGDTLTKPTSHGGLNLSRVISSLAILAAMVILVLATGQRKRPEAPG